VIKWLRALQDRLPADWHADCLPRVGYGDFQVGYPENYYSVLTNELGWRIIARTNMIVGGPNGVFGGLTKQFELRPGGKAEQAEERNAASGHGEIDSMRSGNDECTASTGVRWGFPTVAR